MAALARQALRDEEVALIEAPTGTGKTIAYLVPALTSGRRVVVSTGTKALQAQIVNKDIPLVEQALGRSVDAVAMKGRRNYLCRRRLRQFLTQPTFATRQEAALFDRVVAWAEQTEAGDREEIPGLPDDLQFWRDLSADAESCAGAHC
jgi:ATP-dependent DNA helicase DinG